MSVTTKSLGVVGAGVGGLAVAAFMARRGWRVEVFEQRPVIGGCLAPMRSHGFTFTTNLIGYRNPEIIEALFRQFGYRSSDFYRLITAPDRGQLWFADGSRLTIPTEFSALQALYESWEQGGAQALQSLVAKAHQDAQRLQQCLWPHPLAARSDWWQLPVLQAVGTMALKGVLSASLDQVLQSYFRTAIARKVSTALVGLPHVSSSQESWVYAAATAAELATVPVYPLGGIGEVAKAMATIAWHEGVATHQEVEVESLGFTDNSTTGVVVAGQLRNFDAVCLSGDYAGVETTLVPPRMRHFTLKKLQTAVIGPRVGVVLLGIQGVVDTVSHRVSCWLSSEERLFFGEVIASTPTGDVASPDIYLEFPSVLDWQLAPLNHSTIKITITLAADWVETSASVQKLYTQVLRWLEQRLGQTLQSRVVYQRVVVLPHQQVATATQISNLGVYGLLPSPTQVLWRRPPLKNSQVGRLYHVGQALDPGPGIAQTLVGASRVAQAIVDDVQ